MVKKIAFEGILSTAAKLFEQHDSEIARLMSTTLSVIEIETVSTSHNKIKPPKALAMLLTAEPSDLVKHISTCYTDFAWRVPGFGQLPSAIADKIAVVEIVGPNGMIFDKRCRFGFLIQNRDTYYPKHKHAAEELYFIINGNADWSIDNCKPEQKTSGTFIHHKPLQAHAIQTKANPLLTMWGWTGDITSSSYTI